MLEKFILSFHLVAGIVWVGSVFMGTFVDWPAAKASVNPGEFPFRFVIGQGSRVFYSVYLGIILIWGSGIVLFFIHPPLTQVQLIMTLLKALCLFFMTAFTLYGTFVTWPKIQFATHTEAFDYYKYYMYRAFGTFLFGVFASLLTLWAY